MAFVASQGDPVDSEILLEFSRTRLASFEIPKVVPLLSALPRNANAKIQKMVLRERYARDHGVA